MLTDKPLRTESHQCCQIARYAISPTLFYLLFFISSYFIYTLPKLYLYSYIGMATYTVWRLHYTDACGYIKCKLYRLPRCFLGLLIRSRVHRILYTPLLTVLVLAYVSLYTRDIFPKLVSCIEMKFLPITTLNSFG